jgi:hypothetical protein
VPPKRAAFDREVETGLVLGRAAEMLLQKRSVDQLDMDAAILHRLDGVGDFHQLARGGFWIGEGAGLDELYHWASPNAAKRMRVSVH